ncbi:MAG: PilZ domain-containing protein [Erythrobacter sp.]
MDHTVVKPESNDGETEGAAELRSAPRFSLLIRAAKLVSGQGEFVCVIRDVSATGISVKLFHKLPQGAELDLELQCGEVYRIKLVWEREGEAGFQFVEQIDVEQFVSEVGSFPKRGLRLNIEISTTVKTLTERSAATIKNLSQQGARFECDTMFALDQNLRIENNRMGEFYAKVRWRRDAEYGVVFDDVMTLGDFARTAARLQAPTLIA